MIEPTISEEIYLICGIAFGVIGTLAMLAFMRHDNDSSAAIRAIRIPWQNFVMNTDSEGFAVITPKTPARIDQ